MEALRFGRMEVRPRERQLFVDGVAAGVGGRAFDLLLALIERRDRLVPKSELLDVVWPGLVVEENNLQVQVSTLRKLLGSQAIATVPGRGYRFTAAVDGEAAAAPGADAPRPRAVRRTNLPLELPVLYGRDEELTALVDLLAGAKVVTVVGAGGIGKSRLAQAAANAVLVRFRDGVWVVDLAGLSESAWLANTVASALDVKLPGLRAARDELVAVLESRAMLLVLDNCEHLLEAVGEFVEAIRCGAPDVAVLATSQEPLHLFAEQQLRLLPLAVPASVDAGMARTFGAMALFEARVRAVDPRFALSDETTPLAVDICRRVDGLPLAIELAAARVGTLGLRAVRDKIDARFRILTGGNRTPLRRHQTLRAALEWSHGLLDGGERTVFRRLGVFAGGFTMELAQAVVADEQLDPWAVLEQLSALVDKSLVVADAGETPRYRLLDSTRAFALEQLAAGETAGILRRHATALLALLRSVDEAALDGELRNDEYEATVVPELDNIRAAHEWASREDGEAGIAIALAAHAGALIDYAPECVDWLLSHRQQVEAGAVPDAVAARYWHALAGSALSPRLPASQRSEAAARACALYKDLHKPRLELDMLRRVAIIERARGNAATAAAAYAEARSLFRPEWPARFHALMSCLEVQMACGEGRLADALTAARAEVELSASTSDTRLQVDARTNLVDMLWQVGPIEEAAREARRLTDGLERRPAARVVTEIAYANLLGILTETGRLDEAVGVARSLLRLMPGVNGGFLENWCCLLARLGQPAVAAMALGALDVNVEESGLPSQPNEQRLVAMARTELEGQLTTDELVTFRASGAALSPERLFELMSEALARVEDAGR